VKSGFCSGPKYFGQVVQKTFFGLFEGQGINLQYF
jgi:hypothetical protein